MTAAPAPAFEAPASEAGSHRAPDPGFGVYVHWPFCLKKCPYCDFNSHVRNAVDHDLWRRSLLAELDHYASETAGRRVSSIFFGGGTPSLMAPATAQALIDRIAERFDLADDAEITLEANPTSVEAEKFARFRQAGVNRVSLGVQALDDRALAFLGRQHSADEALAAVELARKAFPRISFDLITARPGMTPASWAGELARALEEGPEHISIYQLTIEPGTPFHASWRRGELDLPDDETQSAIFEATGQTLAARGLNAYEVSNHAVPGAESRHNLTYWRYGDYLGIGPGAHGRLTLGGVKHATRQHSAPEAWLESVGTHGHATRARDPLAADQKRQEITLMGLRLAEGIHRDAFVRELGAQPEALFEAGRLDALREAGYLTLDAQRLAATAAGRLRLNAVIDHLLG
ncbi:coproporphyrinogen III oxidase [Rhodovibrio sodomensis]|uniref:Heme chaperone HemW n=1 Tax=Rhodovibrio sodomensis TaxID=1088 RepID=A0ABS1DCJ8_9PROT|nr:radical SAM family heme chaperone HemW [Rhodovibrio sodomensis]MBK1667641.1 coproporphyrinogen III oxidase [Rhodovibrio sodomensis]